MKVLVIPAWYPNGDDMLMGIYHKEFCEALGARNNIDVNMLFIERERLIAPFKFMFMKKKEVIKEKNYNVFITKMLNVERISKKWQLKRYVKKMEKAFLDYLKSNPKPDVIHAEVTLPSGYAAALIGEKYHIPVVVTEHATYYKDFFNEENIKYTEYVLKHCYFTAVSKYMLDDLPKYVKCSHLPNLVDVDAFKLPRKEIKGLRIAKVCAFRKGKRIEDLLAALKIIVDEKKIEDVKLTIVGDGYLNSFYKEKCQELGLDSYVDFVGRKTKKEIANILNKNNMFVITSTNETFCIPGIEALASGMPVVSTKCFGPEEYIDNKCGKLVEVGDVKALAQAITEVYLNINNYDIKYLRRVADRYSAKNVIDKAIKIYEEIMKKN